MKKKVFRNFTALSLARRIVQILSLVLFPGLFIATFSAIKTLYTALIGGTFDASALAGQIVLVVSMLLITALMGRFFCGFLCAFGTLGDFFWYLGSKLKLRRPKVGTRADRLLKKLKYVVLAGIVLLAWTFGISLLDGTANPWNVFGMLTSLSGWTDTAVLFSLGMLLLTLIAIGSLYIERFFCRYLCPLGAVFAIVSKFRLFKIRKPRANCGSCRACTARCSMGIPLYRVNVVTSAECIDCMNCVEICPRGNATANPKPALAAAVAVVSLSGMYYAGNLASASAANQAVAAAMSVSTENSANAGLYTDGVYTGAASGYHGSTHVQVTVENGYLTDITVLSTGDDAEFFSQAKAIVIPAILAQQSVAVDTVSGATYSSNAIIGAVTNALSCAMTGSGGVCTVETDDSDQTPTPALTATPSPEATAAVTAELAVSELADGTYTGTGTGFRGEIAVTVTVLNGEITAIRIDDYSDDQQYFSRAKSTIIDEILAAQSVDVDVVSGATYSSNGILEAVADALSLEYTSTQPNRNHGGHR